MAEEKKEAEIDPLEVPSYLQPKEGDAAEVEATKLLPLPAADAKSIASTLKKLGLKKVTAKQISMLSDLGVMFPPSSIMRLATGSSVATQVGLQTAFAEVMRIFHESNDKAKLKIVAHIGFLGKTLVGSQKEIQSNARKNLPRAVETQNVRAHRFPTGLVVIQVDGKTVVKEPEKALDVQTSVKQG